MEIIQLSYSIYDSWAPAFIENAGIFIQIE
jgi:hypothetical protein